MIPIGQKMNRDDRFLPMLPNRLGDAFRESGHTTDAEQLQAVL